MFNFFKKKPKTVIAVSPKEKILLCFIPTQSFYVKSLRSQYIEGQSYFLREGNKKLKPYIDKWLESEKIIIKEDWK